MAPPTLPEIFVQFLHKQNLKRRPFHKEVFGLRVFQVDLSPLRLRFSDRSPLIEVTRRELERAPEEIYATLRDVILQLQIHDRVPIVLLEGHSAELRQLVNEPPYYMAALDEGDIDRIMESRAPSEELLASLRRQVPLAFLSPYEVSASVTGSQFFGRDYELKTILSHPDASYTIVGTRRLGKTSLLKEVQRRMEIADPSEKRYLYVDCMAFNSKEAFYNHVIEHLYPREYNRLSRMGASYTDHFGHFMKRMKAMYGAGIVFFLDEIDHLLAWDRPANYELVKTMRACFQNGHCRFLFAGFREAQRELATPDSPFNSFGTPLYLSNFTMEQAAELVSTPMNALGVKLVGRHQLVNRIYRETNGHPNFLQHYCTALIRQLDEAGSREITAENLARLSEDEGFRTRVLETFISNTNDVDKAVAYAVADREEFSLDDIDKQIKRHRLFLETRELEDACKSLATLGVIGWVGKGYRFTVPVFPQLLRERYGGEFLFTKANEFRKLRTTGGGHA